jgi:CRISPR/Cas system CMR subunit Cmr4 (Cas7 group RAMP superfamily)
MSLFFDTAGLVLLAETTSVQPAPTWTDKEVLIAIGSVVGTLLTVGVPVVLFLLRMAVASVKRRAHKAEVESQHLRGEVILLQKQVQEQTNGTVTGKEKLDLMKLQLQQAKQETELLLASKAQTEGQAASHQQMAEDLKGKLEALQDNLANYQNELDTERRRVERALAKDGQTWTECLCENPKSSAYNGL